MRRVAHAALMLGLLLMPPARAGGMARIPGGGYQPFYTLGVKRAPVRVPAFALDAYPVTNADYLGFVTAHPAWRKSQVKGLFADPQYLRAWSGDTAFAPGLAHSPVTYVSWFAAEAYCQAQGKHLPTVDQWEFAARASETQADASRNRAFTERILSWYSQPAQARLPAVGRFRNLYGVWDLHGLVWEWNRDFNAVMVTAEARQNASVDRNLFCAGGSASGTDPSDYAAYMRFAFRSSLNARYTLQNLGFRCAKEAP